MKRFVLFVAASWVALLPSLVQAADGSQSVAVTMRQLVDNGRLAGSVTLVAQDGKILNIDCVGHADIAANRPMRTDTIFRIASMTKPITATALMILQDEGKLSVDDPVSKYLPEFGSVTVAGGGTPATPITIKHLLSHTSGVASPTGLPRDGNPTLAETAAAIAKSPLLFEPGTKWSYGLGLTVVGRIIEVVGGMPYEDFVAARITKPLGMTDTTFYPSEEQWARVATLYRMDKATGKLVASPSPAFADGSPRRAPNPSGGLYSTALDYFHFCRMVLDGGELDGVRIVSPEAVEQMTSIQTGELEIENRPGVGWGLGWSVVGEPQGSNAPLDYGTFGHGGAFGTQAWVLPERNAVAIMLIGRSDMGASAADIRAIFNDAATFRLP